MPHNNTPQASQEATYMKPEDVDFHSPFKFIIKIRDGEIFEYVPEQKEVIWEHGGGGSRSFKKAEVKSNVKTGIWLVLKHPESTQETLFGSTFNFIDGMTSTVYTYKKLSGDNPEITWEIDGQLQKADWYTVKRVREFIKSGTWTILPSSHSKLFDEDSFTFAEQIVSKALAPAGNGVVDDYITLSVHRVGSLMKADVRIPANSRKEVVEATQKMLENLHTPMPTSLLDVIKNACTTTNGRIAVTVYPDHYEIYHRVFFEDCVKVKEDKLAEFLGALLVVDGADKWEA